MARRSQTNPVVAAILLGVMLIFGFGLLFFAMLPDYLNASKLAASSVATTAQITGVYSGSKGTRYLEYSYSVGGKQWVGKSYGNYDYGQRSPLTIHYLAENPSYSAPDPAGKKNNTLLGVAVVSLWNLLLIVFCIAFGVQSRRRNA